MKPKNNDYTATIGIECHVQFNTVTKLFSAVNNDAKQAAPNTLVSHIDFGLPGALPVLNEEAVRLAILAAFALNTYPSHYSKFDRKHYFYPDLPMGYQISQFDEPIIVGGQVDFEVNGLKKTVNIVRAHLEADAGKSVHPAGKDYSLVDLNRSGTPLLEIVSYPDMHSAKEAKAYVKELYLLMRYAKVSDADLFYGNMRFDVNVSVSKTDKLGIRAETKNINSFRNVEKAVEYEIKRQINLLEKGHLVEQETRGWDDAKQKTFIQRTKENAEDYRYMPDPDLPPIILNDDFVAKIKSDLPLMPSDWRKILREHSLDNKYIETILEAEIEDEAINYLSLIKNSTKNQEFTNFLANWFVNLEIPLRRSGELTRKLDNQTRQAIYQAVYKLASESKLSSTNVKTALTLLLSEIKLPDNIETYVRNKGLIQQSDEKTLEIIVAEVIKANPKAASDIKDGQAKAIGFLVGQIMAKTGGQANPSIAKKLIAKLLK